MCVCVCASEFPREHKDSFRTEEKKDWDPESSIISFPGMKCQVPGIIVSELWQHSLCAQRSGYICGYEETHQFLPRLGEMQRCELKLRLLRHIIGNQPPFLSLNLFLVEITLRCSFTRCLWHYSNLM